MSTNGLSSHEAAERLKRYGPNESKESRQHSALKEFLAALLSPLVLILLFAVTVSAYAGQAVDAGLIITIVLVGATINFAQSYRSNEAARRLGEQVAPTATVLRDGAWQEVPRRELVPGDVIQLSAGDLVPADACLLEARDLHIQEAALSGESTPVEKTPGDPIAGKVYLGSSVISGTATAEVIATGTKTQYGYIVAQLAAKPPETEFERGLRQFSYLILRSILLLVLFIVAVRVALNQDPLQSILFAVALAVGLTPEFLPMITSFTLAQGALRLARNKVIIRRLPAIQDLGAMDVLCSDKTGTLTSGKLSLELSVGPDGQASARPLQLAYWNSKFETGIRSPLDAAILAAAGEPGGAARKLDEIPFDFQRRRLSVVVEMQQERLLITKGAPEGVLTLCDAVEGAGTIAGSLAACGDFERQGKRVLAVAVKRVPEQAVYTAEEEQALTLVGLLVFSDPVLPDAGAAVAELRRSGVAVKILTGDSPLVAEQLCRTVGLDGSGPVTGEEIEQMTDGALSYAVANHTVFARVNPAQKTRILLALKRRGNVVGFLGDGINDAPSLHSADVGISVATAVDVAREAASVVLTEPGLRVLHRGILEGRRAHGNILKYLLMSTSSNFGNMFSMAVAAAALPFLPMLPTQLLLNNFLYDLAQITIPTDRVDSDLLRSPHRLDIGFVRNFMLYLGPVSSVFDLLTFYVLLHWFRAGEELFHTGWFVESLCTQTLVLLVIRTLGNPLRSRPSKALLLSTLLIVAAGVAIPFLPFARAIGFVPLPPGYLLFVALAAISYLLLVKIIKQRLVRARLLRKPQG